jgi:hypothetical protein
LFVIGVSTFRIHNLEALPRDRAYSETDRGHP